MTKSIFTTSGSEYLVDDDDYEYLSKFTWFENNHGYAYRKEKVIFMHREIMKPPGSLVIDHKNRNPKDNKKENLRMATRAQNGANKLLASDNKSGYKGVHYDKFTKKWRTQIRLPDSNGKRISLGRYDTAEEAYDVYKKKAKEVWGEFYPEE